MLTTDQENWINHLSDTDKIKIIPYNPKTTLVFKKTKKEIQEVLGNMQVCHCGATSLGISGQGEVDCYIPTDESVFDDYLKKLTGYLGKAGSIYPLRRARFARYVDGIKIEIFLINKNSDDWLNGLKFENYLKIHPSDLERYKELKETGDGLSVREYYRRKIEFINDILSKEN